MDRISINTNEGEIYVNPDIYCTSPFDKATLCSCGEVTFLKGNCRSCGSKKRLKLTDVLVKQKEAKQKRDFKNQLLLLLMSVAILFVFIVFVSMLGGYSHLHAQASSSERLLMQLSGILCAVSVVIQLFYLLITFSNMNRAKLKKNGKRLIASYVLFNEEAPLGSFDGQYAKWTDILNDAYDLDCGYLATMFNRLDNGGQCDFESFQGIYNAALGLSYIHDCDMLAMIRLHCIEKIGLLPNSLADIDQIIGIASIKTFEDLSIVENCLENKAETLTQLTVTNLMQDITRLINQKKSMKENLQPDEENMIKNCIRICGPAYISALIQYPEFDSLSGYVKDLLDTDRIFAIQSQYLLQVKEG